MILIEEFELHENWELACKGDDMTLAELETLKEFIDMLAHAKCYSKCTDGLRVVQQSIRI